MMTLVIAVVVAAVGLLLFATIWSIRRAQRPSTGVARVRARPDLRRVEDGEEKIEASLRRIEEKLGTLPDTAPTEDGEQWNLPETPLEVADRQS